MRSGEFGVANLQLLRRMPQNGWTDSPVASRFSPPVKVQEAAETTNQAPAPTPLNSEMEVKYITFDLTVPPLLRVQRKRERIWMSVVGLALCGAAWAIPPSSYRTSLPVLKGGPLVLAAQPPAQVYQGEKLLGQTPLVLFPVVVPEPNSASATPEKPVALGDMARKELAKRPALQLSLRVPNGKATAKPVPVKVTGRAANGQPFETRTTVSAGSKTPVLVPGPGTYTVSFGGSSKFKAFTQSMTAKASKKHAVEVALQVAPPPVVRAPMVTSGYSGGVSAPAPVYYPSEPVYSAPASYYSDPSAPAYSGGGGGGGGVIEPPAF